MKKSLTIHAALAVAALMAPVAQQASAQAEPQARAATSEQQQPVKKAGEQRPTDRRTTAIRRTGTGGFSRGDFRRAGPGWSNRHVQRMAAKKRNQSRHRKACRG